MNGKAQGDGHWVFGYGSLMWRPGFPYAEMKPGLVRGYHRALCVYSHHYRGTPDRPGLVLGLDRGGSCRGRAIRVRPEDWESVRDYLHEREMINNVYEPRWMKVHLPAGTVTAYGFVVRRDHAQYACKLNLEDTVALVRQGRGRGGSAEEYLANTIAHLDELGIPDGPLHHVLERVRAEG